MLAGEELLNLANWRQRTSEFGGLRVHNDGDRKWTVVAPFTPVSVDPAVWATTRKLWLRFPRHPNLLDAVDVDERGALLLRYAAINWRCTGTSATEKDRVEMKYLGAWGAQLAAVFAELRGQVRAGKLGWLCNPFVKINLRNQVRLGFLPAARESALVPPEVEWEWPRGDERSLVFLVGRLLSRLWIRDDTDATSPLGIIVQRCSAKRPRDRFNSLNALGEACATVGQQRWTVRRTRDEAWDLTEAGLSQLEIDQPTKALGFFLDAINRDEPSGIAEAGQHRANRIIGGLYGPTSPSRRPEPVSVRTPYRSWEDAAPAAMRHEEARAFADALAIYATICPDGTNDAALYEAMARCHLQLGDAGHVVDYARRALAARPGRVATMSTLISGLLLAKQHDDALRAADQLLVLGSEYAITHYLRGRCLFAVRRYVDARESFEHAVKLRPQYLEAQLLRREVDRAMKGVRDVVGSQPTVDVGIPDHLVELRAILIKGRTGEAIEALSRAECAGDPMAQQLRGRMLVAERRFGEAWAVYERIAGLGAEHGPSAVVGKASVLLELGRPAEALELFDQIRPQRPDDTELLEGRARALEALGRTAEAAEAHRRVAELAAPRVIER